MRELRNHGGDVLDRVAAGETMLVTRDGVGVAELRPQGRRPPSPAQLVASRKHLPAVDPARFRRDIDAVIDASL